MYLLVNMQRLTPVRRLLARQLNLVQWLPTPPRLKQYSSRLQTTLISASTSISIAIIISTTLTGCFATIWMSENISLKTSSAEQAEISPDIEKSWRKPKTKNPLALLHPECNIEGDALTSFSIPQTDNLWDRLRAGFTWPDMPHPRVIERLTWLADRPQHTEIITTRSLNYLRYILDELDRRELPYELALIPMAESGYDPFAYSHAQASGLWQLMPKTGEYLGLRHDWWYDGRRDIVASTEAALNYLQNLHSAFGDDWTLTLAAYNSGRGTVSRAIKRNLKQNKPTDYWSLKLPKETQLYIPKILALKQFLHYPELYGAQLPPAANSPKMAITEIESQIDLAQAARLAQVEPQQIYELNPGFKRWATPPDGPHRIAIPAEKLDQFTQALNELPKDQRVSWLRYTIKNGDSLILIGQKFGIDVATIKRVNNLDNNSIRAGTTLLLPRAAKNGAVDLATLDIPPARLGTAGNINYIVKAGDTLSGIAQHHKTSSAAIARLNNLSTRDTLKVGQTLLIQSQEPQEQRISYKVKSGDALSKIAAKFDVSVRDIVRWNNIKRPSMLRPGQHLKIYISPGST